MTRTKEQIEAEIAALQAELAKLDAEPDWEAWRPAAEKACEVYFSCDTDSDLEDMARALIAAAPLMPAAAMTDAEIEGLAQGYVCKFLGFSGWDDATDYRLTGKQDWERDQLYDLMKHTIRETLKRAPQVRWPGEAELREMARECAAIGYERIGEKRNADQVRFGEFDDGIFPQLALEAMQFAIYYMKHGNVPPTCPQSPELKAQVDWEVSHITLESMREIAQDMGYPSVLEALEDLSELRAFVEDMANLPLDGETHVRSDALKQLTQLARRLKAHLTGEGK